MKISVNAYYSDSYIYTYRQTSRCSKFLLKMQFFLWPFRSTCSSHIPVKHPNPLKHAPSSTDHLFQIHHRSQPLSQRCSARPRTQYRKTWVKPLSRLLPPAFGVLQRFVFSTMADCSMDRWVTHKISVCVSEWINSDFDREKILMEWSLTLCILRAEGLSHISHAGTIMGHLSKDTYFFMNMI